MLIRDIWSVPQAAVLRLADQLEVFSGMLGQYGGAQTVSDHLKLVRRYLDWKPVPTGGAPLKDLEQFLQDRPGDGARHLVPAVPPGGGVPGQRACDAARGGDADGDGRDRPDRCGPADVGKVGRLLTGQVRGDLDRLLVHDAGLGMTRLT